MVGQNPMVVAIIIGKLSIGGAENMIYELVNNIDFERFKPVIICYGEKLHNSLEAKIEKRCRVEYLGIQGRIGIRQINLMSAALDKYHADIVHVHLGGIIFGLPWAIMHRKPIVFTIHARPDRAFSPRNKLLFRLTRRFAKLTVVAVSKKNAVAFENYYHLKKGNVKTIFNGVDTSRFYNAKHDSTVFINVARQDKNKNQKMILEAFSKIHSKHDGTNLILVGDGPEHDDLINYSESLGIDEFVEFTGNVSNPEAYYAKSDVFVLASNREALPLSVLEAMAAGLRIISTDVGGLSEIVKENGILIYPGDEKAMESAMKAMLYDSKKEIQDKSIRSRSIVNAYSSREMTMQYMSVYDEMIESRSVND